METTYDTDKATIPAWNSAAPQQIAADKVNELYLPDGRRP
jgi:hypothetical protein